MPSYLKSAIFWTDCVNYRFVVLMNVFQEFVHGKSSFKRWPKWSSFKVHIFEQEMIEHMLAQMEIRNVIHWFSL